MLRLEMWAGLEPALRPPRLEQDDDAEMECYISAEMECYISLVYDTGGDYGKSENFLVEALASGATAERLSF